MDSIMIIGAKYVFLLPILLTLVFFFMQKRSTQKEMLLVAVISLPVTLLIAKIAGHFYYDARPFVTYHLTPLIPHAADNGFPSDHTLISAACAAILFTFNKKWGILAGVIAILVGISRVYVKVHSPIDIIGSLVIASLVMYAVAFVLSKYFRFLLPSKKEFV